MVFSVKLIKSRTLPVVSHMGSVVSMNINLKLVGSHCNMRCTYCYEHDKPHWVQRFMRPEEVAAFIDRLPSNIHLRFLLHGGEPLLYPKREMIRLLQIIEKSAKNRSSLHIQTNGTLIDAEWISIFQDYTQDFVFSISIDSFENENVRIIPGQEFIPLIKKKLNLLQVHAVPVGIVSVVSKANIKGFNYFLKELVDYGVHYLTVNKLRRNSGERAASNELALTELEYVEFLEKLFYQWVNSHLFRRIQIQPLMTLMSAYANNICIFQANNEKCDSFVSLYPGGIETGCDHRGIGTAHILPECNSCQIFQWCGAGCFGEEKDETFCSARLRLKTFVEKLTK